MTGVIITVAEYTGEKFLLCDLSVCLNGSQMAKLLCQMSFKNERIQHFSAYVLTTTVSKRLV